MSEIRNNLVESRFELDVDGHTAFAYYDFSPGVITFTHTDVPQALAGRGVGSQLAKDALDTARARKLKVVAQCPFIAGYYIAKHSEFQDLLKS